MLHFRARRNRSISPTKTHRASPKRVAARRLMLELLEHRRLLNVDWRNPVDSLDVDFDGIVSPLDALVNINYINSQGSGKLPDLRDPSLPFFDVDGDQGVSPLDVLSVINHLNSNGGGQRNLSELAGQLAQETAVTITLGQTAGTREYRVRIESSSIPPITQPPWKIF